MNRVPFLDSFEAFKTRFANKGELSAVRELGRQRFLDSGLPQRKREDWHYSSVKLIADQQFIPVLLTQQLVLPTRGQLELLREDFFNLVFIDGQLCEEYSDLVALKKEVRIEELGPSLKKTETRDRTDFSALNLSYVGQGFEILVPSDVVVSRPLQVLSFMTGSVTVSHPRLFVSVGERSKLTLLESFSGSGVGYFQNSISDLEVEESAKLEYIRILGDVRSSFNVGSTRVQLKKDAHFEALSFCVGSRLGRHNLEIALTGKGANAQVYGLTLATGQQHMDHFTLIDHQVGECSTAQLYKSVLNHSARSVFTGKVMIQKDAQKANSEQLNNNLLLSSQAEADSRPQLEILADDVKATHGSTVGQLNSEELFYLLSRAIPREKALEMLSLGFVQELVFKVSDLRVQSLLSEVLIRFYREGVSL